MKHFNLLKSLLLLCALIVGSLSSWADTYEQLTSIAAIDESAEYVLGIDGTGFHYEGTSSWGKTALPSAQTPIYYTLKKANDGNSFTAEATISGTKYYLQVPTSNTFSMATSTGTNTDLIIGTTQVSGTNYAVANKTTTARHLRINGTSGLRSYAGTTGTMAFFYKRVPDSPANAITASSNNDSWGSVSLSGNVITATPATGYTYADPAYSVNPANSAIVAQDGNKFTVTPSADTEVTINFAPIPTHTATFSVNGVTAMQEYIEGADITFPSNPASIDDKVFMGWVNTAIVGTSDDAPSFISSATMGKTDVTFYAVFANKETSGGEVIKSYGFETISDADWTIDGPARAEGNAYTGSYSGRINSNNTYVTFNSKVKVKEFSFVLKRASTNSNYNVYVETSPDKSTWTAAATYPMDDFGNGSYTSKTKTFDGNTELYVRFHCYNTTAVRYVDDITIKYDDVTTTYTNYCTSVVAASVARPVITLAANPFTFSTTATITCATNGADIKYSYDGENWSDYTTPLTITETKTIYAKAVLNSDESQVASVTATKNLVEPTVTIDATGITNTNVFAGTDAGSLSATVTYNDAPVEGAVVTWSVDNDNVATINATTGAVTLVAKGSVTFTATYAGNGDYSEKTATYEMTFINNDPNAPGTEGNPYTVAQARAAIDAGEGITDVYVAGIVCEGGSTLSSGSMNYWISDDGTETDKFEIYRGKGLNGANFTSVNDVKIGDVVVVYGDIKLYGSTYEFNTGSRIITHKAKVLNPTFSPVAGVVAAGTTVTINTTTESATIYYTTDGTNPTTESSVYSAPITINAATTIKAIAIKNGFPNSDIVEASYTIATPVATPTFSLAEGTYTSIQTVTISTDTEEADIYYTIDGSEPTTSNNKYSEPISVGETMTIKAIAVKDGMANSAVALATYTINLPDYAELPFSFNSGKDDITSIIGLTQSGLGSDYNTSPKLKFDGTGDYLVLKINEIPGILSFDIKGNSFSGGTFKVQTSVDGVNYSDLNTYSSLGDTQSEKFDLTADIRYIKWIYTSKSSGNVGIGNIVLTNTKEITISSAGWATYCSSAPLDFTNVTTLTAFTASKDGNAVKFNKVTGKVPANTGLLVKGETANVPVCASADPVTNLLVGVTAETTKDAGTVFVLMKGASGIGFYKNTNAFTLRANSAYLPAEAVEGSTARAFIALDDETTVIADVKAVKEDAEGMFDLQGRKIAKPTKGLYIVNGKKIVVK